jgi:hypothetical protein
MKPGLVTDAAGIGGIGLIYLLHWRWKNSQAMVMDKYSSQDTL